MSSVSSIKTSIKTALVTYLGNTYKELSFTEDVSQNNWNQIDKGYAVRDVSGSEISGVNRAYTMNLVCEIILSGRYYDTSIDDTRLVSLKDDLVGKVLDIYKIMINTKAGSPTIVMNITGANIPEVENDTDAKILVQKIQFNVIYRIQL